MAMFQPPKPSSLFAAALPKTQGLTKVTVFGALGGNQPAITGDLEERRTLNISWPAQPNVVKYIVYVSPSPIFRRKFREVPKTETTVRFRAPIIVPEDYVWYVWVSYINPFGKEIFIQEEPSFVLNDNAFDPEEAPLSPEIRRDIGDQLDSKYRAEEMRRRNQFMLQSDGEPFYLHILRAEGQRCTHLTEGAGPHVRQTPAYTEDYNQSGKDFDPKQPSDFEIEDSKDPGYQTSYFCPFCFGTKIAGGYLPKIKIIVRYGNLPARTVDFKEQGLSFTHKFNSWTLWHPQLKENDVLIRIETNERFLVKEPGVSRLRGIALHQEFNSIFVDRTAPIYQITDEGIIAATEAESSFDAALFDWSVWS